METAVESVRQQGFNNVNPWIQEMLSKPGSTITTSTSLPFSSSNATLVDIESLRRMFAQFL